MANRGWANDRARDPGGPHDEGRHYTTVYDTMRFMCPPTVADYGRNDTPDNPRSDSTGDVHGPCWNGPIDGNSNADGDYVPAAYPAGVPGSTV